MRALKIRRAAMAGFALCIVLAAAIAGRSGEPLPTFGYVLAVALLVTSLATVGLATISRRPQPPGER